MERCFCGAIFKLAWKWTCKNTASLGTGRASMAFFSAPIRVNPCHPWFQRDSCHLEMILHDLEIISRNFEMITVKLQTQKPGSGSLFWAAYLAK
jgi:hypothetical protein